MVLTHLLGGPDEANADLMSFLLFDPDSLDTLIEFGRRDAAACTTATATPSG